MLTESLEGRLCGSQLGEDRRRSESSPVSFDATGQGLPGADSPGPFGNVLTHAPEFFEPYLCGSSPERIAGGVNRPKHRLTRLVKVVHEWIVQVRLGTS